MNDSHGNEALLAEKKRLRLEARARRQDAAARAGADAAQRLAFNVLISAPTLHLAPGAVVSAYWPMAEEIDIRPLMAALDACGIGLALPVVVKKGLPLIFRRWQPGEPLHSASFGLSEPGPEMPEARPDLILAPLLAFDAAGRRLGWGGGFYDRTIAKLRAEGKITVVGIAFSAQEFEQVPAGSYDQLIDWVATEKSVRKLG